MQIPQPIVAARSPHRWRIISAFAVLAALAPVSVWGEGATWISSLDVAKANQEWGTGHADRSVAGHPLAIGGRHFDKGFGTHAASQLAIDLGKAGQRFHAFVGVDDDAGNTGSVEFELLGDGKLLWKSGVLRAGQAAVEANVDVANVAMLLLVVTDGGDGNENDHADWADAKLEMAMGAKPVVREVPIKAAEILTPKAAAVPRINGPSVFGARPGAPFIYAIPATGTRPMAFSAEGLPASLQLDAVTGRISGKISLPGEFTVGLHARNALGWATRKFRIVVGDDIALTPPMGWNSWNCWGTGVDQDKVLRSARAMKAAGLDQHGWTYVNIDDAWQGVRGGPFNALQGNQKFPDLKALCDEIHSLGFKAGIYSTPWVTSYGNHAGGSAQNPRGDWDPRDTQGPKNVKVLPFAIGKYSFARQDAQQWSVWGIDYLKYDWGPVEAPPTREMAEALRATGRDIVLSLSNNAAGNLFGEISAVAPLAQSWRTTTDITDNWGSVKGIGFAQDKWAPFARPGHWNDADMFEVGANGGGGRKKLTPDEQYTHVSLWCLLSTPLLLGCDLEKMDDFTLGLLTNDEVLAVDQDALGKQATRVSGQGDLLVYAKRLEDGAWAVGLFNLGVSEETVSILWSDLKLAGPQAVRDLWRQKNLGTFADRFATPVASHGVVLVRVAPAQAGAVVRRSGL
jgi:alpha-galactosidase